MRKNKTRNRPGIPGEIANHLHRAGGHLNLSHLRFLYAFGRLHFVSLTLTCNKRSLRHVNLRDSDGECQNYRKELP